jgi:hypothetical protein
VDAADYQRPSAVKMDGKAAGSDSIAAVLLKSGGPNLVNALNEMIQQVWICKTLSESRTEGVLCLVYKKDDKVDCKNYRDICHLNFVYKYSLKSTV